MPACVAPIASSGSRTRLSRRNTHSSSAASLSRNSHAQAEFGSVERRAQIPWIGSSALATPRVPGGTRRSRLPRPPSARALNRQMGSNAHSDSCRSAHRPGCHVWIAIRHEVGVRTSQHRKPPSERKPSLTNVIRKRPADAPHPIQAGNQHPGSFSHCVRGQRKRKPRRPFSE